MAMAGPSKRIRHPNDIDGSEDDIEIESASSSFRQAANKRTKIALAREARAGGAVLSDTEEEEDGQGHFDDLLQDDEPMDTSMEPDTENDPRQYSDEENEEEELDELKATQMVKKQLGRYKDNFPMEEGIIEEVFCRNFMCHSKLRIVLGPLINFIVGHNGSGKSAVLTALQICLGGKANNTNRGSSLKDFIKNGQDSATLSVKIKNQGENAYKPKEYGKSIIVERHFNRAGASGFKIKNEDGKEICKKKSELDDLLDYFALQLDNPINVLTQDKAREFLSNSSPSEKYKFFIKGTNLHTLDSDYKIFEEQLDLIHERLRTRADDIKHLLEKRNQAEQRRKRGERTKKLRSQVEKLRRQFAWKQVQDVEQVLAKYQQNVCDQQEEVEELERKAEDIDTQFEAADSAKNAAERRIDEFKEQLQPTVRAHADEKQKFDKNKDSLLAAKAEERKILDAIKSHKREALRLAGEVELEEQRLSDAGGAEHSKQVKKLAELNQQAEAAKVEERGHMQTLPALKQELTTAETEMREADVEKQRVHNFSAATQAKLREFERQQGGKYSSYPQNTARLCQEIERETRWETKPIGPLGLHIQLLKPEWSSVLEKTFGSNLEAFAVSCRDDQTILSQIARRVGCQVSIIIQPSQPIDTSANEPDDDVDTVLRVLRIDEPAVRDILVMLTQAEQTVLIGDSKQASEYMMRRPRNVKATLAHGSGQGTGVRYDFSRTGQPRSSPIQAWHGDVRMKTDREEQKQILQQRSNDAKKEADAAVQRHRGVQVRVEKAKQAISRHKREDNQLKLNRQHLEDEAERLDAEIENSRPQDGKLQELQHQLNEARDEQQASQNSLQDWADNKAKLDDIAKELKTLLDVAQADLDQANARVGRAEEALKQVVAQRSALLLEKNEKHDDVDNGKAYVAQLEKRVEHQQKLVDEYMAGARQVSERVAVDPAIASTTLDNQLSALLEQHEKEQRKVGGSPEELTLQFAEAEKAYLQAKGDMMEQTETAKILKETLKERQRRWKLFRKYISCRAKVNFMYLLSERKFRGRVKLNHDTQELDIKVEPDMTRASDAGRQAKTLSGGEKSFSTICLLLSIWEAMGSPIRCLDEFDVFMDSVNRKQSMDLMIQTARRSVGRQFILITPQSMHNVDWADDVRIHRMSDPERGQQPLSFHGQEA